MDGGLNRDMADRDETAGSKADVVRSAVEKKRRINGRKQGAAAERGGRQQHPAGEICMLLESEQSETVGSPKQEATTLRWSLRKTERLCCLLSFPFSPPLLLRLLLLYVEHTASQIRLIDSLYS